MHLFLTRFTLCAVVLIGTMYGQSEVGGATIAGTVTDPSGAAIANAKVTVTSKSTGFTRTAETNQDGLYNMLRLPVGTYDLTVEASGFKVSKRTGLILAVGAVVTLDTSLVIGAASESVTVTEEVPVIETSRSQTSTTVNQKAVNDLPVNGRNFLDFATLTPGVVLDPRTGDLSIGGQRGTANSLVVDGGDSNNGFFGQSTGRAGGGRNPYSFSQDAVQEFQVSTSGYNAETGRAAGGVINVVTKSGTNDFHGTTFWFFRDKAMNANTFINNSRNIAKPPYHYNQFGGNVGGPIKRDKLFFFFDYDGQRNKNLQAVFFPIAAPADALSQQGAAELQKYLAPYLREFNNNVYLVKIDFNIDANQRLTARYNANRFKGANLENSGAQSAGEHTGNSSITTDNVAVNYTRVIGGNVVWDSRLIYLRDNEPGEANSAAPEVVVSQNNTTVLSFGRNNFSPRYTNATRWQTTQSLAVTHGRHTIKAGFDFNFERIANYFPGNFSGVYRFNSYADFAARKVFLFTQGFAGDGTPGALTHPDINEYAFYVQDSWRATDRLTLNYGFRYDIQQFAQPLVRNPDPGLAAMKLDTSLMNLDTNNLAGRIGFAYRVKKNDRLVVRGGYGNFYGRTPAILTGTAHSQNGIQVQTYSLSAGFPTYPNVLSAPPAANRTPDIYVFAPDYVQPLSHQYSLNVETQLGKDYSVTVGYMGVHGVHLTRTRDVNWLPAEALDGKFADSTPVKFFRFPGRANPKFGRISVFDSGGSSSYNSGFVQLNKRFAKHFQSMASYTFSKVIDTVPDATSVVVGSDDGKVAQNTLLPNLDRGLGDVDIRHRLILSGVWDITYAHGLKTPVVRWLLGGYQVSPIIEARSGRPFSATVGGDPDGNGNTRTDRPPYLGRNTLIGPAFATVNLRVSRDITLYRERAKFRIIAEAFNLTNRANFSAFNQGQYNFAIATRTFTPTTNFRVNTNTFDPRILQIAAKITF